MLKSIILITVLLISYIHSAIADSPFSEPIFNIGAYNPLIGFKTNSFNISLNSFSTSIEGAVEWKGLDENPYYIVDGKGLDVYFGVFSPDMKKVWSWSRERDGDNGILLDGFVVYEKNLIKSTFHTNQGFSNAMYYSIDDSIQPGMHLLFLLLVEPDTDPNDLSNWKHIGTQPIFITE